MIELNSKSAVITGSSRGIGEPIAVEFAKAGYNLVINSLDQEELSISKEEIIRAANNSSRVVTFPGDISDETVCIEIIDAAAQELGTIDALVNNAGINGCFMCSREAIKKMLRRATEQ
jgi:3-oxoacyl-[acyl-carrier protein] reductase